MSDFIESYLFLSFFFKKKCVIGYISQRVCVSRYISILAR